MITITRVKSPDTLAKQIENEAAAIKNGRDVWCNQYRSLAVNRYSALFQARFGVPPTKPYILRQVAQGSAPGKKRNKYIRMFDGICIYLKEELEANNACNEMFQLLTDYYTVVLNYYGKFGRKPTLNQISAGPTNMSEYDSWTYYEQHQRGGYWMDIEQKKRAEDLIRNGGNKFNDIFLDKIRMEQGFEPLFGTTQEDIDNWDGNPLP